MTEINRILLLSGPKKIIRENKVFKFVIFTCASTQKAFLVVVIRINKLKRKPARPSCYYFIAV